MLPDDTITWNEGPVYIRLWHLLNQMSCGCTAAPHLQVRNYGEA